MQFDWNYFVERREVRPVFIPFNQIRAIVRHTVLSSYFWNSLAPNRFCIT